MEKRRIPRRALAMVCVPAATLVLLAGCGDVDSGSAPAAGASEGTGIAKAKAAVDELEANRPLTIKPLPKPPEKDVYIAQVNCTIPSCLPGATKAAAAALGWRVREFTYDIAKGPSDFLGAVRQAIASKPDVVLLGANYPEELYAKEVAAATEEGVKFVDVGGNDEAPNYVACIQCPPAVEALGRAMADVALADAGKTTEVGIVVDKTIAPLVGMAKGVTDELAANGEGSKGQLIELKLADPPGDNAARVVNFLQRNPDVEYLIYTTPNLLPGTHAALAAAGLGDRVKIIGSSPSGAGDIDLLKQGQLLAWVAGESGGGTFWWRAVDAAARSLQDAPIEPSVPVPALRVVTQKNAAPELVGPPNFQEAFKQAWHVDGS